QGHPAAGGQYWLDVQKPAGRLRRPADRSGRAERHPAGSGANLATARQLLCEPGRGARGGRAKSDPHRARGGVAEVRGGFGAGSGTRGGLGREVLKKIRLGIIFGGRSAEHEVSLRSARSVLKAINREKYDLTLIGIGKDGKWLAAPQALP